MTVKEKAIKLVEMFYSNDLNNFLGSRKATDEATQCAIIHVKGIIEVLNKGSMRVNLRSQTPEYWQQVLTELNQM